MVRCSCHTLHIVMCHQQQSTNWNVHRIIFNLICNISIHMDRYCFDYIWFEWLRFALFDAFHITDDWINLRRAHNTTQHEYHELNYTQNRVESIRSVFSGQCCCNFSLLLEIVVVHILSIVIHMPSIYTGWY